VTFQPTPAILARVRNVERATRTFHIKNCLGPLTLSAELYELLSSGLDVMPTSAADHPDVVIGGLVVNFANNYLPVIDRAVEGYFVLAFGTARLLMEYWVAAEYVIEFPEEAIKWLDPKLKTPHYGTMAKAIKDEAFNQEIKRTREALTKFSHLTQTTWWGTVQSAEGMNVRFRIGPHADVASLERLLYLTFMLADRMLALVSERGGGQVHKWSARCVIARQKIGEYMQDFSSRYMPGA
jgi:hypothetical protein